MTRFPRHSVPVLVAPLLALAAGCSGMYTTSIATPGTAPAPPSGAPSMAVVVTDERPEKEGGKDPRRVGTVRALAGNGAGMREESPDSVRRLVESATTGGLAKAGLAAASGGATTLEVRLRKFWMDGYASYTAELHGDLVLKRNGSEAWRKAVKVSATGEQGGSPSAMFNTVWGWALERWRDRVAEAAAEPEFLAALGVKAAAAAAPAPAKATAAGGPFGLSVASEFRIDDRQKVTFEIKARDAVKSAGLTEKSGAFPEISIRYVSLYENDPKTGNVKGYKVTTRLSLKDAAGQVLWEESFEVKGTLGDLDPKNANYVDATFSTNVDYRWKSEVVKRLKSPEFRKAAGR